jgi:PAS domain S-box-containing protein
LLRFVFIGCLIFVLILTAAGSMKFVCHIQSAQWLVVGEEIGPDFRDYAYYHYICCPKTEIHGVTMFASEYLREMCDAMHDAILVAELDSLQIIYANEATFRLTGFDQSILSQRRLPDLYTRLKPDDLIHLVAQDGERGVTFEDVLRSADHCEILSETHISTGQIDGKACLICVIRDINHRPARDRELRKTETIYRSLISSMPDLIFRIKRDGTYLEFKLPDNLGLKIPTDAHDIIGKKIADLMPEEVARDAMQAIELAFETQEMHAIEYQIEEPSGPHHYEARFTASVEDEVIALVRDITQRKQGENLLRIQRDLSAALSIETNLNRALRVVLDTAIQASGMDCGGIYLLDAATGALELAFYQGVSEAFAQQTQFFEAGSTHAQSVRQCRAIYTRFEEFDLSRNEISHRENLHALGVIPIMHHDRAIGCINVASHHATEFSRPARDALQIIASHIGSAITRIRAEEGRRQSDETMRALLNASQDIALLIDTDWTILAVNEVAAHRLGSTPEVMLGTNGLDYLFPPELAQSRKAEGERVIRTGRPVQFEDTNQDRHFSTRIYPLFDVRHNVSRIAIFARDITEQRQAEEALLRRDRLLEAIAQATSRLMVPGDPEEIFNEALELLATATGVERIFIYESHTHPDTGEPVVSYRYGWTDPAAPQQVDNAELQNLPWQTYGLQSWYDALIAGQEIKKRHQGLVDLEPFMAPAHKLVSLVIVPIFVHNEFWGIVGFDDRTNDHNWSKDEISALRTISTSIGTTIERQQAEAELRREREIADYEREVADTLREVGMALTSSLEADKVLGQILEQARRIVPYNAANIFLLEGSVARLVHYVGYDAFGVSDQQLRQLKLDADQVLIVQNLIRTGKPYLCPDTDADPIWVVVPGTEWVKSWLGEPIVVRGKVVGFFSLDAAERNLYGEKQVSLLAPLAQQAAIAVENAFLFEDTQRLERIKSEMIRMASHDLRSPLTRIKEMTARIRQQSGVSADRSDSSPARYCTLLEEAADEMERIISDILSLERIEALHRATRTIVWCELLAESVSTVRADLEEKHHRISIQCEPALPLTRGDPAQLQRAISNLIGNAIKYTPAGGHIRVNLFLSHYGDKQTIAFEVHDNGIGIPQELQEQLFQPFYRAEQADAKDIPGLGLGLSIVRAAIRNHEGNVYFDSIPGKGSMFGFWVPA